MLSTVNNKRKFCTSIPDIFYIRPFKLKKWILGTKLFIVTTVGAISYSAYKKSEYIKTMQNSKSQKQNEKAFLGEIMDLFIIAPHKAKELNGQEMLLNALKNDNLDSSFKLKIYDALNLYSLNYKFTETQMKSLINVSSKLIDEQKNSKIDSLNAIYKTYQIFKTQHFPFILNKSQHILNIFKSLKNKVPDFESKFMRFKEFDYFMTLYYKDFKQEFIDRSKFGLFYGFVWSAMRHFFDNRSFVLRHTTTVLTRSLILGCISAPAGLIAFLANQILDENYFNRLSRKIDKWLINKNVDSTISTSLSQIPSFLKISILLFFVNRYIAPFSNAAFFASFVFFEPFKKRLADAF